MLYSDSACLLSFCVNYEDFYVKFYEILSLIKLMLLAFCGVCLKLSFGWKGQTDKLTVTAHLQGQRAVLFNYPSVNFNYFHHLDRNVARRNGKLTKIPSA